MRSQTIKRIEAFVLLIIAVLRPAPLNAAAASLEAELSGAKAALLINTETGAVILERNSEEAVEVAGLKRLPALLTICRAFDSGRLKPDDEVTVSPEAAGMRGATAFLAPGEHIRAEELLKAAVILAPGDAICALLQAICPSEAAALEAVNAELGNIRAGRLNGTAMGEGCSFTLSQLSKVCIELSKSEAFLRYSTVFLDTLRHESAADTELANPNKLVRRYSGCFGLATGSVGSSDYSGAFIARRGATTFLALTAGLPDSASRFKLASEMLDYGFSAYRAAVIFESGKSAGIVTVKGGAKESVDVYPGGDVFALLPVADTRVFTEILLPGSVDAPIEKGDALGSMQIKNASGELLSEMPLYAEERVEASSFGLWFMRMILGWLRVPDQSMSLGLTSTPLNPSVRTESASLQSAATAADVRFVLASFITTA